MNIGLYQSAASLSALERWQDAVSQNITSSNVTAYRKRVVDFSAHMAGSRQLDSRGSQSGDPALAAAFPQATTALDFATGEVTPTRDVFDLAIQGEGFFEVQMPDGSRAYTRNGEFNLRTDRTLVTSAGLEVLNEGGDPVVLLPGAGDFRVAADGSMFQGDTPIGRLSVQTFADPAALQVTAGGMFIAPPGLEPTPMERPQVVQGHLEGSNVTPLHEMVDLVLISRAYEANQRIISTVDQTFQKTLDALG